MNDLLTRVNRRLTAAYLGNLKRNHSPVPLASISFDDFPRTAWTNGGDILRKYGVKGTYYTVGGHEGRVVEGIEQYDLADLQAAAAEGHEIASHTFSHCRVYDLSNTELRREEQDNTAYLDQHVPGYSASGFAYPYGEVSIRTKRLYSKLYPLCRGIRYGVNGSLFDAGQLKAVGIERTSWTPERIESAIEEAIAKTGWVIFFTHDVTETPAPYGATPDMLNHVLAALTKAGIEILPVKDAFQRTQKTARIGT